MKNYRKKPVVIQAAQFHPAVTPWPPGVVSSDLTPSGYGIATAENSNPDTVDPGDWIIRGVKGELYACKPDIFEATYDEA